MELNGNIITDAQKRSELATRTDVLEKVKALVLLPGHQGLSRQQLSDYFEADDTTFASVVKRHRDELESDGMCWLGRNDLVVAMTTGTVNPKAPRIQFFPRRAVLRVAMLLRDSLVAKTIRDYLLNAEQVAVNSAELYARIVELEMQNAQLLDLVASDFQPVVIDGLGTIQRKQPQLPVKEEKTTNFDHLPKGMVADIALKALSVAGINLTKRAFFDLLIQMRYVDRYRSSYVPTALGQKNGVMPYRYEHKSGVGYTVVFNPETLSQIVDSVRNI